MADNEAQIEFWNGHAGETWVKAQERVDLMLLDLSAAALAAADAKVGERVLDVGCGCGATSLALATAGADVLGVDISAPMLARARDRAQGLENLRFREADAASQSFAPEHDLIFSRFGVMFFADPVAAFRNLRKGLTDDGRIVFICWQAPAVNPWVSLAGRALQPHLPSAEPVDPRAPGPFAFADPDYLRDILTGAGFADVTLDSRTADMHLGDNLDEAMYSLGEIGPVARALSELSGAAKARAMDAARAAIEPHMTDAGLQLGAAAWLVSARNH